MDPYIALLQQLIRLKSVSSQPESVNRVTETLREFLTAHGLCCTVEELDGRKILYASTQPTKTPDFLMNAHVDVVPAADEKQFEPVMTEDGWMIGRGTGDCLGNAVCMVKVLCELEKTVSAGAVFSSDEEIGGSTTAYMVRQGYGMKKFLCILDHYDGDDIFYSQKGILALKLTAYGKGGHASLPWAADNPVDKLIDGYCRLRSVWTNPTADDQWHDTMTATVLQAGMVHNQIPDSAEMKLNIRYVNPEDRDKIIAFVREKTGLETEMLENWEPVSMSADAPEYALLREIIRERTGRMPELARMNGATDARWFTCLGKPIAILGVECKGIHGSGEKMRISSIGKYADVLKELARKL